MNRKKLTLEQLQSLLTLARSHVTVGGRYAHYKHPQAAYVVEGVHIDEATQEVHVRYSPEANRAVTFARPLRVWMETIEHEGKTLLRFSSIA